MKLPIRLRAWDGSEAGVEGAPVVVINSKRALRHIMWKPGELGVAQAYVQGDLAALWGTRLARHLHTRNRKLPEDPRYADLAARSTGSFAQIALRRVFLPQGISMFLVATPVMVGVNNEDVSWWVAGPGIAVWAIGLFFEATGDRQLAQFKKDPANKGKLMDLGLWRYTRHPNYFGDACV